MKKYKLILFDFDGTIADSSEGILNSLQFTLEKFNLDHKITNRQRFIGPTLQYAFKNFCGLNENDTLEAVRLYREYYTQKGVYQLSLYDGVTGLLDQALSNYGNLIIATSKAKAYTEKIITDLKLQHYFLDIVGANLDGSFSEKNDIIARILAGHPECNPNEVIIAGDREFDIKGAHSNAIDSIGVTYGFGSEEEIIAANPTYIAHSVKELNNLLNHTLLQGP